MFLEENGYLAAMIADKLMFRYTFDNEVFDGRVDISGGDLVCLKDEVNLVRMQDSRPAGKCRE